MAIDSQGFMHFDLLASEKDVEERDLRNRLGADLVSMGMKTFNEVIREGLLERGWEIYPSAGEGLYEFWWKPAEHKGYWRAHNPNDPGKDNCMPIDQAIAWEMREVGN